MSEVYAGQIISSKGKIQVTETHGTNTGKQAARIEDLRALSDGVVHKTIEEDKTESVTISGTLTTTNLETTNLETTNQISAKTVIANDSISVSNTKLNANGFETDGRATIGGDVEIGGKLTVKGQDVSGTTDQSLAIVAPTVEVAVKKDEETSISVIVATATDEGIQTEIKADTVKTAANKEVEISAAEVITEANSKSTIIAPEIWLKDLSDKPGNYIKVNSGENKIVLNAPNINLFANSDTTSLKVNKNEGITAETASTIKLKANDNTYVQLNNAANEVILTATTISLDSAATNTTASLTYDSADSEFKKVKTHTGDDIIAAPTGNTGNRIVNNNALRSYNRAVDAKITTTKAELQGSIKDINDNLGTKPADTTTVWKEIKAIQDNISNGLHFIGVYPAEDEKAAEDILNDYISNPKAGDLAIVDTQEYVYSGSKSDGTGKWNQLGDEQTHATYSYVDTKLADKVDNATYDDEVKALKAEDDKIRGEFAVADTALQTAIEGKVAQGDFNTLSGTVSGLGTSKLDKSVYDAHIEAYNNHITAQEGIDAAQNAKIKAIEDSVSSGAINTRFNNVETLAQKGVDDAKAAQDDIDELARKVGEVTDNDSLVDQLATISDRVTILENKLPGKYKLDTGLFGELETDTEGNLTGALIIRTVQKPATYTNGINNNEIY